MCICIFLFYRGSFLVLLLHLRSLLLYHFLFILSTGQHDTVTQELTSRGLQTGDAVRVFNDRGEFKVHVNGNESIRPGCARMYELAMGDFTIEGNMQSVTNDTMLERGYSLMCGPVTPFSDTLIQIEKA